MLHGRGARPIGPQTFDSIDPPKPKKPLKTPAIATYEAAVKKGTLKDVPAAQAKSLETKFANDTLKTENLSPGRVGASILGAVVNGELFTRTKGVFPGAKPTWQSAGKLVDAPAPKPAPVKPSPGWAPRPKSVEARAQKTVADRMGLMSNADFQLKGADLTEVKKAIAKGEFEVVNATPKGLAGVGYTGYVANDLLIVEKHGVHPGAKSTFFLLGPLD